MIEPTRGLMVLSFPILPDGGRRGGAPASGSDPLLGRLRARLLNELHMGTRRAGDRLPSIRAMARETGEDHRVVARAYHALEQEGLVEVRGRSGVWVADPQENGAAAAEETGWMAEVLASGWERGISCADQRAKLERCADGSGLRCACVESNEDQMVAYCRELGQLTRMRMEPVYVAPNDCEWVTDPAVRERTAQELAAADLVVTTQYHSVAVRRLLGADPVPVVVLRINPALAQAVRDRLARAHLTVVSASREFGDRLRLMYADSMRSPDRIRVVLAEHAAQPGALDPGEPVLLTRAARERMGRAAPRRLVFGHSPTVAPETLHELAEAVVRANLARG